jgi:hypothetical protein
MVIVFSMPSSWYYLAMRMLCGVQDLDVHISRGIANRIHRLDRLANNSTGSMHGPCA